MEDEYNEITVKDAYDRMLTLKVSWDADIYEWINNFKVILKWLTFCDGTIKRAFPEEE